MADDHFYVKTLRMQNFRCFEDVELGPFDPHFNLLVGENGAGKSSVLVALANLFRQFANLPAGIAMGPLVSDVDGRIAPQHGPSAQIEPDPFSKGMLSSSFAWQADALHIQEDFKWKLEFGNNRRPYPHVESETSEPLSLNWINYERGYPILLRFTTNRHFLWRPNTNDSDENNYASDRWYAFRGWMNVGATADELRRWMRDETIVALQRNQPLDHKMQEFNSEKTVTPLDLVQRACRECIEGAQNIFYDGSKKNIVVALSDGRALQFSGMSDGERALVGMVAEIARRVTTLNWAYYGASSLEETAGVVLIDEIDLHLHPRWQRRIVGDLKRIFPKIQFFATTHSPQVIGEAKPEEIVLLTPRGQGRPAGSYGMDSNWILECVMEAEGRNPEIARRIKSLFDHIEADRLAEAKAEIQRLREELPEVSPDIVSAEAYIWNLEHGAEEAAE